MSDTVMTLVGGSALLVFSIESLSQTIQYLAGSRFRAWINVFAGSRLSGVCLGFALSLLMGSSGAVTVMLVGLANARLLSLEQVLSVTLGAIVGSTVIVQVMALPIYEYGWAILTAGVSLGFVGKRDETKQLSRGLIYLGIVFLSMSLIKQAGGVLEQSQGFRAAMAYLRERPGMTLFVSAFLTAITHSSAATIAFILALLSARGGSVSEAIPWVLGANLGTTSTAFLAGARGGVLGKQAALAHLLVKVTGVVVAFPLSDLFARFLVWMSPDIERQIANSHTLFNVFLAAAFLPFVSLGVRLVRRLIPEEKDQGPFVYHYLDSRSVDAPELALAQAHREILRLSDYVEKMVEQVVPLFRGGTDSSFESLRESDRVVDFLNKGIKMHLTALSQAEMTPEQVHKEFELLFRTSDLEAIGDIVERNILSLARKIQKKGYAFSEEGWSDITLLHGKVIELLKLSSAYFASGDQGLAAKLAVQAQEIDELVIELGEKHVQRLHQGVKESVHSSSVHLDLLGNLQRIASLAVHFTQLKELR